VVKDADKVARRFSEVFGASWRFYDFRPKGIVLHDQTLRDVECFTKVAIADIGGRSIKLIQPISGPSTYLEFLQRYGEGFLYFSLGTVMDHDKIIELISPAWNDRERNMQQTGFYEHKGGCVIDMPTPVFSGGKRFNQVGIVLKDEERAARRYHELLGICPWTTRPIAQKADAFLDEKLLSEEEISGLHNDAAFGYIGDIQLELLKPAGGPSCHRKFLDRRGNGIQHLSLGRQADYDQVVAGLKKAGINSEYSATLGGVSVVNYLAMQGQMGGFQVEITKIKEGAAK
jgi:hypothetical protein